MTAASVQFPSPNRRWLLVLRRVVPIVVLGFFLARFFYELDPLSFSFSGDWLGSIGLAVLSVLFVFLLRAVFYRLSFSPSLQLSLSPLYLLLVYIFWPQVDLRFALVLLLGSIVLTLRNILFVSGRSSTFLVGSIVFILYLLTLGDHVGRADTFEFQVVAPQLGIAHPTGYPLFILIGKLFSFLPISSMAWRINLTSAVFGTITIVLTYRLIITLLMLIKHPARNGELEEIRLKSMDADIAIRLSAAIAAIALAASNVYWGQAIIAEVYALNALFVSIVLTLLIKLIQQKPEAKSQKPVYIYSLALTLGLAFAHHLTSVVLIPPIALTLLFVLPKLKFKQWLLAIGYLLLGLTPWLFILLRWPGLHNGSPMTLAEWTGWIFGQRFSGALNLSLWSDPTRWGIISRIVIGQFGVVGSILAQIGLLVLIKRSWRIALITFVTFAGYIFYGLVYNVPDVDVFIIPAFSILSIWIGISVSQISLLVTRFLSRITQFASPMTNHSSLLAIASLLPIVLIATNFPLVNQHDVDDDLENWGRYVLSLPIPDHAALLVDSEKIAPLYYLQVTEHIRSDLDIVVLGDEAQYRSELDRRIAIGQPVYLARFLPNLPYHMRSLGPLVEISTQPGYLAPNLQVSPRFGNTIDLTSILIDDGNPLRVTFGWQALTDSRPNYHLRLQLIDDIGHVWWEDTGAHPVTGDYPTGAWTKGETVADYHEIKLAAYMPTGDYILRVGFFVPFRDDGLLADNGTPWYEIQPIHVNSSDLVSPLANEVRFVGSNFALTSLDDLGDVPPSSEVALRLNSIGIDRTQEALLSLVDSAGMNISTAQLVINVGQSRFEFTAPVANGRYTLRLNLNQPARCYWLAPITLDCEIGSFEVAGDAIGNAINFDNQVLLTATKIDRDTVKPNEVLHIDLAWRGLKTWPDNYTAFVHLIGPDGKVHGQVDQWPVQGTLPTSRWTAGQTVHDPYVVSLTPDAPSGKYQVEAGWYLLATLRRLSVLDSSGRPSDDHVIIGEFSVP